MALAAVYVDIADGTLSAIPVVAWWPDKDADECLILEPYVLGLDLQTAAPAWLAGPEDAVFVGVVEVGHEGDLGDEAREVRAKWLRDRDGAEMARAVYESRSQTKH